MKFGIGKRIQQERFLGKNFTFNPIEFVVSDCDTKEEAEKEVDIWIKDYFNRKKEEINKTPDVPFGENPFIKVRIK